MDYNVLIENIQVGSKNKTRLKNKTSYVDLWWEDDEKWFMNIKNKGSKDAHWVIEKDLEAYLIFAYNKYKPELV